MAHEPARTLADAYQQCWPDQPLRSDDPRYLDLTPGRGDNVVRNLTRQFDLFRPSADEDEAATNFVRIAFLSHRGAGKTTELNRLHARLRDRFHRVYLVANKELDAQDIDAEDLLFALAVAVERDAVERGTPLPEAVTDKVGRWFAEVVSKTTWAQQSGVSAELSGTGGLFDVLSGKVAAVFKHTTDHRLEIRQALRRQPTALVTAVNQLLAAARAQLREEGRDLVVVVDNLDRYPPREASQLVIDRGAMLCDLHVHLVLTPPISLYYKPVGEPLGNYYRSELMNTVRIRGPQDAYDAPSGPGFDLMLDALRKRFDLDALVPDPALRARLVAASGGAMRDLLHLVQQAILHAAGELTDPETVLDADAVGRAVATMRTEYRDKINVNGWMPTLAAIARAKQLPHDDHCMDVLFQRLALKYNGEGWYDVHPLVAGLPEFAQATAELDGD